MAASVWGPGYVVLERRDHTHSTMLIKVNPEVTRANTQEFTFPYAAGTRDGELQQDVILAIHPTNPDDRDVTWQHI